MSTITVEEIAVGEHIVAEPTKQDLLLHFGWVRVVPFTVDHAFVAGKIEAALQKEPSVNQDRINSLKGDLLIAGVAKTLDAPIVTRNTDDFELFEGVTVETY